MLMLLSPAKRLTEGAAVAELPATQPPLLDAMGPLLDVARGLTEGDLRELMGISDALATLNRQRFAELSLPFTRDNAKQAALLFDGDVYRGLAADSLSAEQLEWAQDRVVILSGLYGAVRPLDLVQPYRLEMGTQLRNPRGKNLYEYWGEQVTDRLNAWEAREIVNLASNEYFSVVQAKRLKARVITPVFKDVSGGKARTLAFFAKQARGAMVRWAIEHGADSAEALKESDAMGYRYFAEASTPTKWEFRRKQPPKKG